MKEIRFPQKVKVQESYHKAYVLLLSAIDKRNISDFSLRVEQSEIVEQCLRILSALYDHAYEREKGILFESCIHLKRSLHLQMWNDIGSNRTIFELCPQLPIGLLPRFLENNIHTIEQISLYNSNHIQRILKCTMNDVNIIQSFIQMLNQSKLNLHITLKNVSQLNLTIDNMSQKNSTIQQLSNNNSSSSSSNALVKSRLFHIICYNTETFKLLFYRRLQSTLATQNYSINLENNLINNLKNIYITLICDDIIGLDCYIPSLESFLTASNYHHTTAGNNTNNNKIGDECSDEEDFILTENDINSITSINNTHLMNGMMVHDRINPFSSEQQQQQYQSQNNNSNRKIRQIDAFQFENQIYQSQPRKKRTSTAEQENQTKSKTIGQKSIKHYFQTENNNKNNIDKNNNQPINTISKRNYKKNDKKDEKNSTIEYGIYDDVNVGMRNKNEPNPLENNCTTISSQPMLSAAAYKPPHSNFFEEFSYIQDKLKDFENINNSIKQIRSRINLTRPSITISSSQNIQKNENNLQNIAQINSSSSSSPSSSNSAKVTNQNLFEKGFF